MILDVNNPAAAKPIQARPGPHLFVDDYLIAGSTGIARQVVQPQRSLDGPVVSSGPGHLNWQCWMTVLHDSDAPECRRFRMWYNAKLQRPFHADLAYLESSDGINWPGPYRNLDSVKPITHGADVLDDGPHHHTPQERYKLVYWPLSQPWGELPEGARVAFSPDGMTWSRYRDGAPAVSFGVLGDSLHAFYDPIRKRYFLITKLMQPHTWTNADGLTITKEIRLYGVCFSQDFKTWTRHKVILAPDSRDLGVTEWYSISGFQVRGDLILAFLTVLRDDLTAIGAPPEAIPANYQKGNVGAGIGYTVLAWTRDGVTWHRDRHTDPFFEPDPRAEAWDHAVTWIDSAVPVGDEVYLYYGGYRWGHKYGVETDRQIGMVKATRDRYVARVAGASGGRLLTPPLTLCGDSLSLNAAASSGEIRVQVRDAHGQPIPGFTLDECRPIQVDSLSERVHWRRSLAELAGGQPVQLEFTLRNASLFAFNVHEGCC